MPVCSEVIYLLSRYNSTSQQRNSI